VSNTQEMKVKRIASIPRLVKKCFEDEMVRILCGERERETFLFKFYVPSNVRKKSCDS
jgi:hypothetical protein